MTAAATNKAPTRDPLNRLWRSSPRRMSMITAGLLATAVVSSPITLHLVRVFPFENARPKSGLWTISVIAGLLAVLLMLGRRWHWPSKPALLLPTIAFCLLLIELSLRIWPPYEVAGMRSWYLIDYYHNTWGFPDTEPRSDATNRIMVLGDSITYGFGDGLDQTKRYPDLVETMLRQAGHDVDLQVVATGDTEFDTYMENYRRLGPEYDPNVLVIGWCLNDINYGAFPKQDPDRERRVSKLPTGLRKIIRPVVRWTKVNELFLWTVLSNRGQQVAAEAGWLESDWLDEHNRTYHERLVASYKKPEQLEQLRGDLRQLRDECRRDERSLLVVVFPFEYNVDGSATNEVIEIFRGALEELDIAHVDLQHAYAEAMRERVIYSYRDPCHPNADGHHIAAELTFEALAPMLRD